MDVYTVVWWVIAVASAFLCFGLPAFSDVRSGFNYLSPRVALVRIGASTIFGATLVLSLGVLAFSGSLEVGALAVGVMAFALFQLLGQAFFVHSKRVQIVRAWREGRSLHRLPGVDESAVVLWVAQHPQSNSW